MRLVVCAEVRKGAAEQAGVGQQFTTLGPATGQLLAEAMVTGRRPAELGPFEPLR
ncbi:hypothetical protein ACWC9T_18500 [Kitasatospora sp. NPDC001159]